MMEQRILTFTRKKADGTPKPGAAFYFKLKSWGNAPRPNSPINGVPAITGSDGSGSISLWVDAETDAVYQVYYGDTGESSQFVMPHGDGSIELSYLLSQNSPEDIGPSIPTSPEDIGAATAEQGEKADTAIQPGDAVSSLTNDSQYLDPTTGYTRADANSAFERKIKTKGISSTPYTVLSTDSVILVDDDTAGSTTINFPPASTLGAGWQIVIKKIGNTANVTLEADGAETIDGATTQVIGTQYDALKIITDGTNFFII